MERVNQVWIICLAVLICVSMPLAYQFGPQVQFVPILGLVFGVFFIVMDQKELTKHKLESPSFGWVLFFPGYFVIRSILHKSIFSTVMTITVSVVFILCAYFTYFTTNGGTDNAKQAYCTTISEIIHENGDEGRCVRIDRLEQLTDREYRGTAQLSNGDDTFFTVSWADNDNYELTIR